MNKQLPVNPFQKTSAIDATGHKGIDQLLRGTIPGSPISNILKVKVGQVTV